MTTPKYRKKITIYKAVADLGTNKVRLASTAAVDKGHEAYWCEQGHSDFGFLLRISKHDAATTPVEALQAFMASQSDKAKVLRESANLIDQTIYQANQLLLEQ